MDINAELSEVQIEDNNAVPEKNKKRRLKSAAQLEALEKFYNEHKYPTESMKSQLAESLKLTEKQISGWFCHRRLKDKKLLNGEVLASGRQDYSGGAVQDHGSGLRQDSCGSTKQGDFRHLDPKEVESRTLSGQDFSAADHTYGHGSHYNENHNDMDDTSSGSSSPLQNKPFPHHKDPFPVTASRYETQNKNIALMDMNDFKKRNGPSGYLKVKGRVENAAITAVKRQLGRQYREDGPPLGVEFDSLPPGAFESSTRDPENELFDTDDPVMPPSLDVPRTLKQPNFETRYEVHNSKVSSYDADLDGTNLKSKHGSDFRVHNSHSLYKEKSSIGSRSNRNSLSEMKENSIGETSLYDSSRNYRSNNKYGLDGNRMDSNSSLYLNPYVGNVNPEHIARDYDDMSHTVAQKSSYEPRSANLKVKHGGSIEMENRSSRRIPEEDQIYRERRAINEYHDPVPLDTHPTNEMRVARRVRNELPQPQYPRKASRAEAPTWTTHIKRSAQPIPSSFSEDETAETSTSMD